MKGKVWVYSNLTEEQLKIVREAERTLGSQDLRILVFDQVESNLADLNPSQIECLQGLERKLGLTAVALRA